ncbi:hypothetical protein [Listeria valentina]|uniref:hypothetical protein n=1 Tax=Listeria valentina TaxID=2705293 RepID=UPI0014321447|nr:hypothetical protein [Listeria valentina]
MNETVMNSFLILVILVICVVNILGIVVLRRGRFSHDLVQFVTNQEVRNLLIGAKDAERKKAVQYLTASILSFVIGFLSIILFANLDGFVWTILFVLAAILVSGLLEKKAEEILGKKIDPKKVVQILK